MLGHPLPIFPKIRDGPQWAQNAEAIKRPPVAAIEETEEDPSRCQIMRYDTLVLEQGMTNREYLKRLLEVVRSNHGEDAFSTRTVKQQIASMEREPKSAEAMFLSWLRARTF